MSRSGVRGSEGESLPGAPGFLPLFPEVSRKRHCRRPNSTICSWFLRSCRNCTLSWWAPLSVSRQILLLVVRGRANQTAFCDISHSLNGTSPLAEAYFSMHHPMLRRRDDYANQIVADDCERWIRGAGPPIPHRGCLRESRGNRELTMAPDSNAAASE